MSAHGHAVSRTRRRPPGWRWWYAALLVGIGLLTIGLGVVKASGGDGGVSLAVSLAVQVFVVWVYWPELRRPHEPYRSPLDPLHFAVVVALLTNVSVQLLLP